MYTHFVRLAFMCIPGISLLKCATETFKPDHFLGRAEIIKSRARYPTQKVLF